MFELFLKIFESNKDDSDFSKIFPLFYDYKFSFDYFLDGSIKPKFYESFDAEAKEKF